MSMQRWGTGGLPPMGNGIKSLLLQFSGALQSIAFADALLSLH